MSRYRMPHLDPWGNGAFTRAQHTVTQMDREELDAALRWAQMLPTRNARRVLTRALRKQRNRKEERR